MGKKPQLIVALIVLGALIEVAMLSFLKGDLPHYLSATLLLGGGLLVGIFFLLLIYQQPTIELPSPGSFSIKKSWFAISIFILASILGFAYLQPEINAYPLTDYYNTTDGSDVIPQIGILVDRYLSGEYPYTLIKHTDWGFKHDLFPTYLPLTWMPFIIAELTGLDYRQFAFLVLALALAVYAFSFFRTNEDVRRHTVSLVIGLVFIWMLMHFDKEGAFRYSIETIITGFYLLLALSVLSTSNAFRIVMLTLCLLSRYSLVLWVPLYFIVVLVKEKKPNTLIISLAVFALFAIIYVFPFLSHDMSIFLQGYDYHSLAALEAWKLQPWQTEGELPFTLFKGMGFGAVAFEYVDGSLLDKVTAYRHFHLGASLVTVLVLLIAFFKMDKRVNHQLFLLASLKIYLVVFYNFIQIPFSYLFFVSIIISVPIIGIALQHLRPIDY